MINTKAVAKHYQQLSEKERALLMIQADMNNDEQEFLRLKTSATFKTYSIRADKECEIAQAWFWAHKDFITCKSFLHRKMLIARSSPESESFCELYGMEFEEMDMAFIDVMKTCDFPINHTLIENFGCGLAVDLKISNEDDVREGGYYPQYFDLFMYTFRTVM